ncbi:MAG: hypothetical protein KDJ47_06750 [Hyphomicrobiaceae bacterium]|nr:hypothetical protein [Hyphomicrobiaceae bacterium]
MSQPADAIVIEKKMTLTAAEFAKSMAAFVGEQVQIVNGRARVSTGENGSVAEVTYVPLPSRRIGGGLLELPQALVTITLAGMGALDAEAFVRRFDIAFQRGGG